MSADFPAYFQTQITNLKVNKYLILEGRARAATPAVFHLWPRPRPSPSITMSTHHLQHHLPSNLHPSQSIIHMDDAGRGSYRGKETETVTKTT